MTDQAKTSSTTAESMAEGSMIDVGGHKLYYRVSGEGSPTVVIEAGTGGGSVIYSQLEQAFAKFTKVVVYDRAGLGRSETSAAPIDAPEAASQLRTLLHKAGIAGPYILAGHSFGGIYIRHFTAQFRDEVAGLVFMDSSHPEMNQRLPLGMKIFTGTVFRLMSAPVLGPAMVKSVYKTMEKDIASHPPKRIAEFKEELKSPKHIKAVMGEYKLIDKSLGQTTTTGSLGDIPIVVFSATLPGGAFIERWHVMQGEIAALSTNSQHFKVKGAKHFTLIADPQFIPLIAESVQKMVQDYRQKNNI